MSQKQSYIAIGILTILQIVGIAGIGWFQSELILSLTPLNLLTTLLVMLIFHRDWKMAWVFPLTFALGLGVEIVGVNTGFPFGSYEYGEVLGPKILETPYLIGVNWLILLYGAVSLTDKVGLTPITKAIASAGLMVVLDFLIEPIAVQLGFWTWTENTPPIENYLAWFVISFLLALIWHLSKIQLNRRLGQSVFLLQLLFFGVLTLLAL